MILDSAPVRWQRYLGIFTIACATLAYQVLITRIFSVTLYYHFAFAGVTLAMLGLTIGASRVYFKAERYSQARLPIEFCHHATWFALTAVGLVLLYLNPQPLGNATALILPLCLPFFAIPFIHSGICVALILTRLPHAGGKLYAADLCGAALGCIGVIGALFIFDPFTSILLIAALSAAIGWLNARDHAPAKSQSRLAAWVATIFLLATVIHAAMAWSGAPHIGVIWAKGKMQTETLFERWNTFSRVRVSSYASTEPSGWGFGTEPEQKIRQLYLDIDADASTMITEFTGDLSKVAFLKKDVVNASYQLRDVGHTAVIGIGGGRDILSALYFGAKRVTGIEINPANFEALTDRFADFAGHLHLIPGVTLKNAEARSYINRSPEKYDLIQISLIDTWAATAAGGLTLSENRLYTVEAWQDFYRKLSPTGMLSISRWYNPDIHPAEFNRLLSIASVALTRSGVPADQLQQHVAAVSGGRIVTVITSPSAITQEEWSRFKKRAAQENFKILAGPDVVLNDTTKTILSGHATPEFYNAQPENIVASTDDKPFFFYTWRMRDSLPGSKKAMHYADVTTNMAITILTELLGVTVIVCIFYIAVPLYRSARRMDTAPLRAPLLYFACIGLGFMLVEISQMQRLMVFLGHPVYGLSVVLFTLLLFGGIGSFTAKDEILSPTQVNIRALGLMLFLILTGLLTQPSTDWSKSHDTSTRIFVSIALLAPPAFFMGMMFPMGLWASRRKSAEYLPFFWGANGVTSVLASVLGMVLSMELGISTTYYIGVTCYFIAVWTLLRLSKGSLAA